MFNLKNAGKEYFEKNGKNASSGSFFIRKKRERNQLTLFPGANDLVRKTNILMPQSHSDTDFMFRCCLSSILNIGNEINLTKLKSF